MWKPEHRAAADRRGLRYDSDLTDAEWALVAPLIRPAKRGGRPRTVDVREVLNAIFSGLWTGCPWKALPKDLPPRSTVWEDLDLWWTHFDVAAVATELTDEQLEQFEATLASTVDFFAALRSARVQLGRDIA